jgi:NAD(P)H-hydrate repair Nnr-like enzyme with NAD(P)H-hydrate dehydratase domain
MDLSLAHLSDPAPLVVDASGLYALAAPDGRAALARRAGAGHLTVITPHDGEFARFGISTAGGRLAAARRAADVLGTVVVLKGPGTVVAWPGGADAFIDFLGGPELATAGSGDVLAGLAGGLLATAAHRQGNKLSWEDVALLGARAVGLHGLAGRLATADSAVVTATDVAAALPRALGAAAGEAQERGGLAARSWF